MRSDIKILARASASLWKEQGANAKLLSTESMNRRVDQMQAETNASTATMNLREHIAKLSMATMNRVDNVVIYGIVLMALGWYTTVLSILEYKIDNLGSKIDRGVARLEKHIDRKMEDIDRKMKAIERKMEVIDRKIEVIDRKN